MNSSKLHKIFNINIFLNNKKKQEITLCALILFLNAILIDYPVLEIFLYNGFPIPIYLWVVNLCISVIILIILFWVLFSESILILSTDLTSLPINIVIHAKNLMFFSSGTLVFPVSRFKGIPEIKYNTKPGKANNRNNKYSRNRNQQLELKIIFVLFILRKTYKRKY